MFKKILSVMLVLLLCVSIVPLTSKAEAATQTQFDLPVGSYVNFNGYSFVCVTPATGHYVMLQSMGSLSFSNRRNYNDSHPQNYPRLINQIATSRVITIAQATTLRNAGAPITGLGNLHFHDNTLGNYWTGSNHVYHIDYLNTSGNQVRYEHTNSTTVQNRSYGIVMAITFAETLSVIGGTGTQADPYVLENITSANIQDTLYFPTGQIPADYILAFGDIYRKSYGSFNLLVRIIQYDLPPALGDLVAN